VTARDTTTENETMTARRILVVDDEPGMRAALAEVLARGAFEVELAATAATRRRRSSSRHTARSRTRSRR
jgi:DNA-binding NtrC family response regulator